MKRDVTIPSKFIKVYQPFGCKKQVKNGKTLKAVFSFQVFLVTPLEWLKTCSTLNSKCSFWPRDKFVIALGSLQNYYILIRSRTEIDFQILISIKPRKKIFFNQSRSNNKNANAIPFCVSWKLNLDISHRFRGF